MLANTALTLAKEADGRRHVWHLYVVRHPQRDRLREALAEAEIETGLHYPIPIHLQPAYSYLQLRTGKFPVAEEAARDCLSLPLYPELTAKEQIRVAENMKMTSRKL